MPQLGLKLLFFFPHCASATHWESIQNFQLDLFPWEGIDFFWALMTFNDLTFTSETSSIPSESGWVLEASENVLMKVSLQDVMENVGSGLAHKSYPSRGISCSSTMLWNCSQKWHMSTRMVRGMVHMTCEERLREGSYLNLEKRNWRAVFSYQEGTEKRLSPFQIGQEATSGGKGTFHLGRKIFSPWQWLKTRPDFLGSYGTSTFRDTQNSAGQIPSTTWCN